MHRRIRELAEGGALSRPVVVDVRFGVLDAVRQLNERKARSALVFDGYELVGIFTERDVLTRVVQEGRHPAETVIGEVMTVAPLTIDIDETLSAALRAMRDFEVCHLPVQDGHHTVGLIALRDILEATAQELTTENELLHEYIHGPASRAAAHP